MMMKGKKLYAFASLLSVRDRTYTLKSGFTTLEAAAGATTTPLV